MEEGVIWEDPTGRIRVKKVQKAVPIQAVVEDPKTKKKKKPVMTSKYIAEHQVSENTWVQFNTSTLIQCLVDGLGAKCEG